MRAQAGRQWHSFWLSFFYVQSLLVWQSGWDCQETMMMMMIRKQEHGLVSVNNQPKLPQHPSPPQLETTASALFLLVRKYAPQLERNYCSYLHNKGLKSPWLLECLDLLLFQLVCNFCNPQTAKTTFYWQNFHKVHNLMRISPKHIFTLQSQSVLNGLELLNLIFR